MQPERRLSPEELVKRNEHFPSIRAEMRRQLLSDIQRERRLSGRWPIMVPRPSNEEEHFSWD